MELDDLKNTWNEMGSQSKPGLNLTTIDKLTKTKVNSKLNRILLPEILGALVCIVAAVFIVLNFDKLDNTSYQVTGILSIILCLGLPVLSFVGLAQLYKTGNLNGTYADSLKDFASRKIRFCKLQKLNITLSYLLLVTVAILLTRLFGRSPVTDSKYFFLYAFTLGYSFVLLFSKFVFKSYNRTIQQTEALLQDLPA